jgi:pimeloyl-ACP methyl ester carboxylesterase
MKALFYERAGLRLAVWETGVGAPMLFQHGLCGDASQPADVFPVDCGWRCLTMECRGHGRSDAGSPEEFSIATFAEDVASVIEAQEWAPVVLGGISMGAAIALQLAILRPELVRALILARPAWIDENAPANMESYSFVGDLLRSYPPDEARRLFEASEIARELAVAAPDNLLSLRSFFSRQPIPITRELLCRIAADGPGTTRNQIKSIGVRTLVLGNGRDCAHPMAMARELAAMIPRAQLAEVTSKSESRERYRDDCKAALSAFLNELG